MRAATMRLFVPLALLLLVAGTTCSAAAKVPAAVQELIELQEESPDGVIRLDTDEFAKFVDGRSRPYSLMLMANAEHMADKPNLQLRQLRKNFGAAAGYARAHAAESSKPPRVFFVDIEYADSKKVFRRLDVKMLPLVLRIPGNLPVEPHGILKVDEDEMMGAANYPQYPWRAADILDFVSERTGISIPVPPAPTLMSDPLFPYYALAVAVLGSMLAYKLYYARFMRSRALYLVGGLAVYWFSVSGGMYNIIRSMPLFIPREGGKLQLFLQGQGQLGAEGFIQGSRYTGFGLALALAVMVAPRLESARAQRLLCFFCLFLCWLCFNGVVSVYQWKTGYRVSSYLFA